MARSFVELLKRSYKNRPVLLASVITAVLLAAYLYKPHYRLYGANWDTLPAQLLPISLLHEGDFDLDEFGEQFSVAGALPYPLVRVEGRIVSAYPIIPGLMSTPVFWAASRLGLSSDLLNDRLLLSLLAGSLWTALSAGLFFLVLRREELDLRATLLATATYGLASACFGSSIRGAWQHGPALLFLNGAWLACLVGSRGSLLCAGFLLGLAIETRLPLLAFALAILAVTLMRNRDCVAWLAAGCLLPILAMRVYAHYYWGSALEFVEYPVAVAQGAALLEGHGANGFLGLLVSPARGLFVFSPVYFLGMVGAGELFKAAAQMRMAVAMVSGAALYLCINAMWPWWWGGDCFGYRIITEVVPAGSFLCGLAWQKKGPARPWLLGLGIPLLVLSMYVNALGAYVYPCQRSLGIGLEAEPAVLWDPYASDIYQCSKKLWGVQ